jgi:hypothetical protein
MPIIPEGRARIHGRNGQPNTVAVELDGTSEVWSETRYTIQGGHPLLETLRWHRDELPSLPEGNADDWEANRGQDARIAEIYRPDVRADRSGTIKIDWERRVRPAERHRYKSGASVPSWILEIETIFAPDIRKVATALKAAEPKSESELVSALDGLEAVRNWDRDRI